MFGHVLLITAVLSTPFAVRMEAASALDGTGQVPLVTVEKARCRPGDKVETGLQGQVPVGDRVSGRAAEGYFCNMAMVGGVRTRGFANFDVYGDCAYYTESPGGFGGPGADGHGNVVDVSDPTRPVVTATLTARAMGNAGESLRVNAKRGLLVADHYGNGTADPRVGTFPWLAVYDVATDCRHPRLLADVAMPHGRGHEGWFSPDGLTYFMTSVLGRTTTAVDLSDPTNPKELATWPYPVHGGSTSEDGTRSYMASVADPNAVLIVDTSDVGPGRANAGRVLSTIPITHNFGNQNAYRLDYGGHPYLLSFGESTDDATAGRCTNPADTSFDMPRFIDLADEMHPVIVSKFVNEVSDPVNCRRVSEDNTVYTGGADKGDPFWFAVSRLFMYDTHYCTPDRLRDPTIMACATFLSGLRVYDIRDPRKPREIAYYNTGTTTEPEPGVERAVPPVESAIARPVIRRDRGEIWWVTSHTGFHVAKLAPDVWPFREDDPCPGAFDSFQAQYDAGYAACRAHHR
jgi:hypothetical protein